MSELCTTMKGFFPCIAIVYAFGEGFCFTYRSTGIFKPSTCFASCSNAYIFGSWLGPTRTPLDILSRNMNCSTTPDEPCRMRNSRGKNCCSALVDCVSIGCLNCVGLRSGHETLYTPTTNQGSCSHPREDYHRVYLNFFLDVNPRKPLTYTTTTYYTTCVHGNHTRAHTHTHYMIPYAYFRISAPHTGAIELGRASSCAHLAESALGMLVPTASVVYFGRGLGGSRPMPPPATTLDIRARPSRNADCEEALLACLAWASTGQGCRVKAEAVFDSARSAARTPSALDLALPLSPIIVR